jgi:single-strand DNA-binding protein
MSNQITVVGNLGGDPELRYTSKGTPVCNMSIADNRRYKNANGEWVSKVQWLRIVLFSNLAENSAILLKKGDMVQITGSLQIREYEDRNGQKQKATEVIANDAFKVTNLRFKPKDKEVTPDPSEVEPPQVDDADIPF